MSFGDGHVKPCTRWLLLLLLVSAPAAADRGGTTTSPVFMVRTYSGEVPSAQDGRVLRLGVILPPKSKVVKVEAYMDEKDRGTRVGAWDDCDVATGECETSHGRMEGLARIESESDVEISASFVNTHPDETQWAKLKVTFLPFGNISRSYEPRECVMRTRCGFAGYIPGERDGVGTGTAEAGAPQ
jgi:hypothetical protein